MTLAILIIVFVIVVNILTSLIKNIQWNWKYKAATATILSVLAAVLALFMTGGIAAFTVPALFQTFTTVFASSQLIYQFIMKGTVVEDKLALSVNKPKGV
jgi:uncharacterized membrane protein